MLLQDSDDEPGVLGGEDSEEPKARPGELPSAAGERMAGHRYLGMPTEARPHRPHHARGGAAAEREHAVAVPPPRTHPIQQRRGGDASANGC